MLTLHRPNTDHHLRCRIPEASHKGHNFCSVVTVLQLLHLLFQIMFAFRA